jgi:hypothetical protein
MDWLTNPNALFDHFLGWVAGTILACFDAVFSLMANGLLVSPDVTVLPQVQALTVVLTWAATALGLPGASATWTATASGSLN